MEEVKDTDKSFCSILFDILSAKGVENVVCSPGSRNAPLLIAAAARHELKKHVVVDERSAAFMALGMSIVSKRPVALVCTSGTALLNYGPAIAEAFYQSVPLIVISADRPEQWIDQDDSQTLRQFEAFSNFVKKSYQLPAYGYDDKELLWYANRIVNDAMIEALSRRPGPVHINIQLGEPLNGRVPLRHEPPRLIDCLTADSFGNKEIIAEMARVAFESKVMVVAGFLPPDSRLHKALGEFASLPNVAVMAETLSNLHLGNHASAVDSVLTAYPSETLDAVAPDLVISLGGSLVSRKLKEYLRRHSAHCQHWSVGYNHTTSDCFMSLSRRIEVDPARFFHSLYCSVCKLRKRTRILDDKYSETWNDLRNCAAEVKEDYIKSVEWSELKAFDIILSMLPKDYNLFLSNGTSVRYAQLLSDRLPHASYCNRGVSGIDGSASTAIGGAKGYKGQTLLLTGDLSMAYDLNSLALPEIPDRMKIIVIDNQGGGIFRFIPSTSQLEEREEYFCAAPLLPIRELASGYGWNFLEADSEETLVKALSELFTSRKKTICRVVTDGQLSAEILKKYMQIKVK